TPWRWPRSRSRSHRAGSSSDRRKRSWRSCVHRASVGALQLPAGEVRPEESPESLQVLAEALVNERGQRRGDGWPVRRGAAPTTGRCGTPGGPAAPDRVDELLRPLRARDRTADRTSDRPDDGGIRAATLRPIELVVEALRKDVRANPEEPVDPLHGRGSIDAQ